jgi:hypothetical protein
MMVSAPHRVAHTILSTFSPIEEDTVEFPMLALIFTANALPMIIGSLSGWRWLAGITARARHLTAHHLGLHTLAFGDERHLSGDLPGPRPLQLRATVTHHPRPARQPARQIDHRVGVGIGPDVS